MGKTGSKIGGDAGTFLDAHIEGDEELYDLLSAFFDKYHPWEFSGPNSNYYDELESLFETVKKRLGK